MNIAALEWHPQVGDMEEGKYRDMEEGKYTIIKRIKSSQFGAGMWRSYGVVCHH